MRGKRVSTIEGVDVMASYDDLNQRLRQLTAARFKDYEQELLRRKSLVEINEEFQKKRDTHRRAFLTSIGTDMKKFDAAVEHDNRMQEAERKAFLDAFRGKSANRRRPRTESADTAIRSEVLAESGQMVLPVVAASLFAADKSAFDGIVDIGPEWITGPINSGWVFPDDPTRIRIKDSEHDLSLCWPNHYVPPPEFAAQFTFTPATTGTYEMTAVLAFHGFYVLVSDDSWWNCRFAYVKLTAQMNVHQYVDAGWKDFPAFLDVRKDNTSEVTNFDRTFFPDYTAALRGGDPVIVTAKGVVEAFSHGGGTANYIEPLFLSVQKL
jgi:hypothetical protein